MSASAIPVIDLFAGPGGLGEGFSAARRRDGSPTFRVRLSIEKDPYAFRTLLLRAFFRQFPPGRAPDAYYDVLRGDRSPKGLFDLFPTQAEAAEREAWNAELGVTDHAEVSARIRSVLKGADDWVLIGGPPCQAYSVAGRSRNKGNSAYRPEADERQFLYTEYLRIIADFWPAVFVMENVKGLLSATLQNKRIFDRIRLDLSSPGRATGSRQRHAYRILSVAGGPADLFDESKVEDYIVDAERFGIPQARHRVILVGVREDLCSQALVDDLRLRDSERTPVSKVLEQLPGIRSGLSGGTDSDQAWLCAIQGARERRWVRSAAAKAGPDVHDLIVSTISKIRVPRYGRGAEFIEGDFRASYETSWFHDARLGGVCNHEARDHMPSDLHRYLFAACFGACRGFSPKLRHFPKDLLPQHDNVALAINGHGYFADRFRVQVATREATTVTSHISKDGHGFIHPDPAQCRSLTVREAARLQTFPDSYYFFGPRTQQYVQVGNAVPPLLAKQIAMVIGRIVQA